MIFLLGERIKKLRRDKQLSIEEVAEKIGVRRDRLYKWEISDGYPDIETLKKIADFFEVPLEELTSAREIDPETKYNEMNKDWADDNAAGNHRENYTLMLVGLKYFPNDKKFYRQMLISAESIMGTAEEKPSDIGFAIGVQEDMMKNCKDDGLKYEIIPKLAEFLIRTGNTDRAKYYIDMLPDICKTKETVLMSISEGEEKEAAAKEALVNIAKVLKQLEFLYGGNKDELLNAVKELM